MGRRFFLGLSVLVGLSLFMGGSLSLTFAAADDYPKGPIRGAVAYEPGGGNDRSARIFQPFLEKELGVPVILENRPGAGGEVAMTYLYREKPEGYVYVDYNMPDLALIHVMQTPIFKPEEIYPIVVPYLDPRILLVKKDSPLNTLGDFIEEAKKNPGKLSISVSSSWAGQKIQAVMLKKKLNLDFKIVPFKGGGPAATAMLGGHVTATWGDVFSRLNLRDQTKCIGVSAEKPHPLWKEGQPINEQLKKYGITIPDFPRYQIQCVRTEFKTRYPERYKKLQNAILKVAQSKEYMEMEKKQQLDYIRVWEPGEKFEKQFKEEFEFFKANKTLFNEE